MDAEQEKQLVEKAKSDKNAFGQLYDEYYPKIFGYVLKRTAGIGISQDITSNVFFKAMNNIHRFRWQNTGFSSWLYRIANNEIADHYRHNGHFNPDIDILSNSVNFSGPSPETEILAAEAELKRHEDFITLQNKIAGLSVKYQEVITLRFFENKQLNEIAEILGKREGTIKSLLHRGLEKLRKSMEENAAFF